MKKDVMELISSYYKFEDDIQYRLGQYTVSETIEKINDFKAHCDQQGMTLSHLTEMLREHHANAPTPMSILVNELCVVEKKINTDNAWTRNHALDVLRHAIGIGMDVNASNGRGYVPLHYAAAFGKTEIIQTLLEAGADINALDDQHRGVLSYCIDGVEDFERDHVGAFNLLIDKGANLHQKMISGECLLYIAVSGGRLHMMSRLLQEGLSPQGTYEEPKNTLLHIAASGYDRSNMNEILRTLMPYVDPHRLNNLSETPLHTLVRLRRCKEADCVQLLVEAGVDIQQLDSGGSTALERARDHGLMKIVSYLEAVTLAKEEALELQNIIGPTLQQQNHQSHKPGQQQESVEEIAEASTGGMEKVHSRKSL